MKIFSPESEKLCHLRPGDCVRLLNKDGSTKDALYIIAYLPGPPTQPAQPEVKESGSGLYASRDKLFLVNLETGKMEGLPHLSSRVQRAEDAVISVARRVFA